MSAPHHYTTAVHGDRRDWHNVRSLLPYLWEYRGRVLFALACLVFAKAANVGVPLILKGIVDELDASLQSEITLPVTLLLAYGALRLASSAFNELRDTLFARVRYHAVRRLSVRTVEHLHALSLRFHLERKTGAISRDLQRAAGSLATLLNYMVFSILPVLVELGLVLVVLFGRYKPVFSLVVLASMTAYIVFTVAVSNWRMEHRQTMNQLESEASNEAMDGLINYETVKYFGNERLECGRYDRTLARWEDTAVLTTHSMSLLNFGQGAIIALGVTAILFFAAAEVKDGSMTLGDLVLVNAMLLQLFIPLGFLGIVYRQIKYALVDMDHLVKLFEERPEITDGPDARPLAVTRGEVRFEHVDFHYAADRPILHDVDFVIPSGKKVAVVGASGAGKSTLVRLLFRFYDVSGGCITIDGHDIRHVTQESLRAVIGIVPQDTVLFNDTLLYNLQYARPDAGIEEIHAAARLAHIHDFIMSLPQGYDTRVGERGLKLSGGEKQRVAIARAVLKRPRILVFDEATSALDTQSEQGILQALREAAARHTALVIAHRLSTVVDADQILVMDGGRIVERGSHEALLAQEGLYARLWNMQRKEDEEARMEGGTVATEIPAG